MSLTRVSGSMVQTNTIPIEDLNFNGGSFNFRNKIINGSFDIWQRGGGNTFSNQRVSTPTPGFSQYTADRWLGNRNGDVAGQNITRYLITQADVTSAGTALPRYGMQWQRAPGNTLAGPTGGMYQFYTIETNDSIPLAGKTITLSFYAKRGANYSGGDITILLYSGTGIDQRVYQFTNLTTAAVTTRSITSNMSRYTVTGTLPVSLTQVGVQMSWIPTGTAGADDSVYITGVQLEEGPVATPFEFRPVAVELALCQRYYEKSYNLETVPGTAQAGQHCFHITTSINGAVYGTISYQVTKRITPVVSIWSYNGTPGRWANGDGTDLPANCVTLTWPHGQTQSSITLQNNSGGGLQPTFNSIFGGWAAEAEL